MKKWTSLLSLISVVTLSLSSVASAASSNLRAYEPASLIKTDGSFWSWGGNQSVPTQVHGITGAKQAFPYNFIVKEDDTVWHWTRAADHAPAELTQVKELSGLVDLMQLSDQLVLLDAAGRIYTIPLVDYSKPDVSRITKFPAIDSVAGMTSFDTQYPYSPGKQAVYLKKDGTVWTNTDGQSPISAVKGLDHILDVDHNVALKSDGTVWTWTGAAGDSAKQLEAFAGITTLKQSHYSKLAIDNQSRLWFWGMTITGVSDGTTLNDQTPVRLASINDVKDAVAAERSLIVLTNSGKVYATSIERDKMPANPQFTLLASGISSIKEGWRHVIMQQTDGTLLGWGINKAAELGYGDYDFEHLVPVPVQRAISITLNDEPVYLTSGVITRNSQSFVPLRSVFEKLGAAITFNNTTKMVTIERSADNGEKVTISLDTLKGDTTLNGQPVTLQTKPFSVNGTTYLPLRFISEQLGARVEWSQQDENIAITFQ